MNSELKDLYTVSPRTDQLSGPTVTVARLLKPRSVRDIVVTCWSSQGHQPNFLKLATHRLNLSRGSFIEACPHGPQQKRCLKSRSGIFLKTWWFRNFCSNKKSLAHSSTRLDTSALRSESPIQCLGFIAQDIINLLHNLRRQLVQQVQCSHRLPDLLHL